MNKVHRQACKKLGLSANTVSIIEFESWRRDFLREGLADRVQRWRWEYAALTPKERLDKKRHLR